MNATPRGNYATVSRNSPAYFRPRFRWVEKTQTLSDESANLPFAKLNTRRVETLFPQFRTTELEKLGHNATKITKDSAETFKIRELLTPECGRFLFVNRPAAGKVRTLSAEFIALGAILSTPSTESLPSKIQTLAGKFRRRRRRNLGMTAAPGGAA